jgi:hypothetical protein
LRKCQPFLHCYSKLAPSGARDPHLRIDEVVNIAIFSSSVEVVTFRSYDRGFTQNRSIYFEQNIPEQDHWPLQASTVLNGEWGRRLPVDNQSDSPPASFQITRVGVFVGDLLGSGAIPDSRAIKGATDTVLSLLLISDMSGAEHTKATTVDTTPTVWGLYNDKAKFRDKVLLKDWDSSINSLLLFVRALELTKELVSDHTGRRPFSRQS